MMYPLPHRPPFILLDQWEIVEPGYKARGHKLITACEGWRYWSGPLLWEALGQLAALALGQATMLTGIDTAILHRPLLAGEQLHLEAEIIAFKRGFGKRQGRAWVEGELVGELQGSFVSLERGTKA
ncbi:MULTISPECIES: hypothetical protein [Carboxydocella]|nr:MULTISPECIES: hypothetical protein [Carboxydocella]